MQIQQMKWYLHEICRLPQKDPLLHLAEEYHHLLQQIEMELGHHPSRQDGQDSKYDLTLRYFL
jgi:hypothetical protein